MLLFSSNAIISTTTKKSRRIYYFTFAHCIGGWVRCCHPTQSIHIRSDGTGVHGSIFVEFSIPCRRIRSYIQAIPHTKVTQFKIIYYINIHMYVQVCSRKSAYSLLKIYDAFIFGNYYVICSSVPSSPQLVMMVWVEYRTWHRADASCLRSGPLISYPAKTANRCSKRLPLSSSSAAATHMFIICDYYFVKINCLID